ncbi:hypothetical protein QJQ45_000859 [Haematococcus lacustris]|nr:hypothetical protein QJQ45_000859 [Haematococcus lacustris]
MKVDEQGFATVTHSGSSVAPEAHATATLNFAIDMIHVASTMVMPHDQQPVVVRCGIHSGPITSGVVGSRMPKFCLFGDTMNVASRMESTCAKGCIQVSSDTYKLLANHPQAGQLHHSGGVELKGKGRMDTYVYTPPWSRTPPWSTPDGSSSIPLTHSPAPDGAATILLPGTAGAVMPGTATANAEASAQAPAAVVAVPGPGPGTSYLMQLEQALSLEQEPARSNHWDRWFSTGKLANQGFEFERTVETDGVSVCVHYTRPLPTPPAPPSAAGPSSSNSSPVAAPAEAAVAAHELGLPRIGKGLAEQREFVFNPATQIGVGIDPGVTQAVSAASGVWDPTTGQLLADQLRRWKLTKGQVKHGSGLNNARRATERWLAPIKPHLQHLAAASSAGTSLEANLKHITVTLATWDAVWEVYLDPKWAEQRLRLYGAQDRTLEQFFKKLEEDMAEVSMERHGRAKQLVVFFGAASIGTAGGWGADAVLRACCKVVCRPRGTDQRRGRVVLVDEHRTTRVSSAVNGQQPCERQLNKRRATRPTGWKPPAGQVEPRLLRPAWSQQRDQPVRGLMWCPVVAPRKPPQAPRSSQAATQATASKPGPSTPPPAKRNKRTKAEPEAAEPSQPTKAKGKAAKAKPAPQPGRWIDRDCNAALNMQRIGESKWRPLELCFWPDQGRLPAKGKEYPGLGYKRLRDKPPKAQQQQPAEAQ